MAANDSTTPLPHGARFVLNHRQRGRELATLPDPPEVLESYTLVNPDGSSLKPEDGRLVEVPPLGEGSFGVVYRARDHLEISRAVKVFGPEDLTMSGETTSYKREIRLANAKPYKNVIRIMNCGVRADLWGRDFGCYVMDFVNGRSLGYVFNKALRRHWSRIASDPVLRQKAYILLFDLLDQLVAGMVELHEADVAHMDLKPANALVELGSVENDVEVDLSSSHRLFLTDLGASKKLRTGWRGRTTLIMTKNYFPSRVLGDLHHHGRSIQSEALDALGEYIDLYALGRTVEELVFNRPRRVEERRTPTWDANLQKATEEEKERIWRLVLGEEFEMLEMVVDDLVSQRQRVNYKSSAAVARVLTKISRRDSSDLRTSIALTDRYLGLEVKVGNELVQVAPALGKIVDHPVFQRLRHLPQLGLISQIFPGATHTRFSHSLLTFNRAKQFLMALSRSAEFRYLFGPQEIDRVLAAALLHDLGQYPFAHGIEDLRRGASLYGVDRWRGIKYDHEVLPDMLSIHEGGSSIEELLGDVGISSEDIHKLVAKDLPIGESPVLKLSREIINGTIDVDRVSYLKFDSEMSGVPYGKGIDVDNLIQNLCVRFEPGLVCALGVEEEGVSSAEMLLAAIYWMYRNVYWHPSNRKVMVVLKYVANKLFKREVLTFAQYLERTMWGGDAQALKLLCECFDSLGEGASPLEPLLRGGRIRYRRIVEIGEVGQKQGEIYNRILHSADPEHVEALCRIVAQVIGEEHYTEGSVLWDVPLKPRLPEDQVGWKAPDPDGAPGTEAATAVRLWVRLRRAQIGRGNRWERIEEYSGLARQVMSEEDRQARKIRVFVAEEYLDRAGRTEGDLLWLEKQSLEAVAASVDEW